MAYLIDSDVVIDLLVREPEAWHLIDRLTATGLAISVITYMEVYQGTLVSPDPGQSQAKLENMLA